MKSFKNLFQANIPIVFLVMVCATFYYQFFIMGKVPIPADTIVGMYHPFRDNIWSNYPAGVPFKNFLITDPVRQQYVWRYNSINELKQSRLPLWNQFSFSGTPLLANFQSAVFYPLNIIFFIMPFETAWGLTVFLQTLLASFFMFYYLRMLNLGKTASIFGSIVFSFGGFSISWLEWNTVIHTALWLPLILMSIEKLLILFTCKHHDQKFKSIISWNTVMLISLCTSFFAGHLQVFFYMTLFILSYLIFRLWKEKPNLNQFFFLMAGILTIFLLITAVQWIPTVKFILLSAREYDQGSYLKEGWFIPFQNLVQFIIPDFFGNPATGNYWGIWNYAEFVGYIGIIPLAFSFFELFSKKNNLTVFFGFVVLIALFLALPTPFAKIPFLVKIPYLATAQPTRLIFIIDFALAVLSAFGFHRLKEQKNNRKIIMVFTVLFLFIFSLWIYVFFQTARINSPWSEFYEVSKRNLIFPSLVLILGSILILLLKIKKTAVQQAILNMVILLTVADLFRFGWKFTPFSQKEWIFPETKIITFLKNDKSPWRLMSLDSRIMPPNFSVFYQFQDVAGYDPLYLSKYQQFISAWESNDPTLSKASFNRIITPKNINSFISDILGVKYVLNFGELKEKKLDFIMSEGMTYLYQNNKYYSRAFLVDESVTVEDEQAQLNKMFFLKDDLSHIAVMKDLVNITTNKLEDSERVIINQYEADKIILTATTNYQRLLVLTDIFYPAWKAYIDGRETNIYPADFTFRAVLVPPGLHKIEFRMKLI
ncbi:hypothetical protein A2Y99_02250 [Candidatus Gottesmanbacteria bacterium RBG_13_37_7]|uniref:YfhO family protein n=1 Tax=Candidatus Gottesmanbacteria bacterium RBG_13_37_7 TaxID=1798369 RepID=A0A1F5YI03_9BACT|nr:MAG: hypothetical protein A2Y99_02250 [Candidatus Gottesmanbacteria bacterium RBG_13_37_7]